ncbi:hypothetical protein [Sphingobium xenophagum]|uniref:hypothetical protein n=1 Tax=Sphingobium xenophagum TaxID=121428 RepID=UPI001C0D505E|nr:hypothetical protein [Sphingobium xenophagum]QWT15337.1 hypothetical protein GTV57_06240 [Sphingobium xenophagum]
MIDPTLLMSLFAKRTKDALVKATHQATVYGQGGNPAMDDIIRCYIENMRDTNSPRYMTFTEYRRNHTKDDVLSCSAIMLEYPYSKRQQLEQAIARLAYPTYQIDTQSDFTAKAEARIVVAFPLAQAIKDPRHYTRAASLLWDEIGIDATTDGCVSATFLFAPYIINPRVIFRNADEPLLDAKLYIEFNEGHLVYAREEQKAPEMIVTDDGLFAFAAR